MSPRRTQHATLKAMFQLNSWIPLVGNSSKATVRNAWRTPVPLWKGYCGRSSNRSRRHSTLRPYIRRGSGIQTSSPWSQCFSRSYASVLPTSLGYIIPLTRGYSPRSPDADSVRSRRKGRVDLRQSFHEDNQGTERYKKCIAFSMFSDACHQLKCHSRRQQRQREKRTLHGPGYPSICRC